MIRSSHIPPLLDKVCQDGIQRCLLITSEGDLLGCSNYSNPSTRTNTNSTTNNNTPPAAVAALNSSDVEELGGTMTPSTAASSSSSSSSSWMDYNPQNVAALIAETLMDYRQMGAEVASLNTVSNATTVNPTARTSSYDSRDTAKRRGRGVLHCLILEMEKGLICLSYVKNNIYVVALAESTTQEGMLKAKMTALAVQVHEAFSEVGNHEIY